MKKVIVLFVAIVAFAANSFAQTGTGQETQKAPKSEKVGKHKGQNGKHAHGMDMKKDLNLSDDQSKRIKDIKNSYKGKMTALKTDNSLSKEQRKTQMSDLKKSEEADVKGVLTADQYTKFTEMKKQRRNDMKAHKGEYKRKGKKQGGATPAPKSN